MVEMTFVFSMIWSVCASVDEDGRKKIDSYLREIEGSFPNKVRALTVAVLYLQFLRDLQGTSGPQTPPELTSCCHLLCHQSVSPTSGWEELEERLVTRLTYLFLGHSVRILCEPQDADLDVV